MIVPTRFGLKFAPVPTLALEYEDDLNGVVDATGESATSLYVYRDGSNGRPPQGPTRKLHVVELPMLTRTSETQQITRQLQQDNGRFLAPGVVSETQLKRLLDRLVQHLPAETQEREPSWAAAPEAESARREDEASESELEESVMEVSVLEESVAESSRSEDHEPIQSLGSTTEVKPNRGAFLSQEAESDQEDGSADEAEKGAMKLESRNDEGGHDDSPPTAAPTENEDEDRGAEADEDAKKTRALQSESDVSEEDVQSEELEYFSEDGSDEDSF